MDPVLNRCLRLVRCQVGLIGCTFLQLHQGHGRIVDDADQLGTNPLTHAADADLLQGADALCLDEDLVGERWYAQHAHGGAVVLRLFVEEADALGHHAVVLLKGALHGGAEGSRVMHNARVVHNLRRRERSNPSLAYR